MNVIQRRILTIYICIFISFLLRFVSVLYPDDGYGYGYGSQSVAYSLFDDFDGIKRRKYTVAYEHACNLKIS